MEIWRPLRIVSLIVQNQRGACIVPASQNQVLYCEPDLGVGASFGLGAATQTWAANTLAHTFIQRQERAANMPASWQPWHFGGTTPNSLVLARLLISLKLKTSSPQTLVLVCSHSSTACDDLRPPDSSVLFSPGLRLTSSLKYWQARVKFVTPQTWHFQIETFHNMKSHKKCHTKHSHCSPQHKWISLSSTSWGSSKQEWS